MSAPTMTTADFPDVMKSSDDAKERLRDAQEQLRLAILDLGKCEDRKWAKGHLPELLYVDDALSAVVSEFECDLGYGIEKLSQAVTS